MVPTTPTLPAVHVHHLIEVVRRWNVSAEQLLEGFDLRPEDLQAPGRHLGLPLIENLIARARHLTGEDGLGIHLGHQMTVVAHGDLGFAAMTARTLGEALDLAVRFAPIRTTAFSLHHEVQGDEASLYIDESVSLGAARDVILFAVFVGLAQIAGMLTGRTLPGRGEVMFAEPSYYRRLASLLGRDMRFGRRRNRLVFPASALDSPLLMHDPAAQRIAHERCEAELQRFVAVGPLLSRIRSRIARVDVELPSLEELAREMHLSPRTLKRRLSADGSSYRMLLDESRRARAETMLRQEGPSIEEVAALLGYSDAANFTRAFRRWTGATPAAYRRDGKAPGAPS